MNLVPEKLSRVRSADYTKCAEVQAFIQELVEKDDLRAWALRDEPVVIMALPEKVEQNWVYRFLP